MLREAPSACTPALAGRAGVARLTLELRTAIKDAEAAEAEAAAADLDSAREKLRARLQPLVEDRRAAFATELIQVRAEAAAAIAAARRAAAAMGAREHSLVDRPALVETKRTMPAEPERAAVVTPQIEQAIGEDEAESLPTVPDHVEPATVAPLFATLAAVPLVESIPPVDEMLRWFDDQPQAVVDVANDADDVPVLPLPVPTNASHAQLATTNVGIDAEAFAQAFASAFAALLDERGASWAVGGPGMPAISAPSGPAVPKPSFWTHARHPDVVLIGLAMIIMMIVVAAWLA